MVFHRCSTWNPEVITPLWKALARASEIQKTDKDLAHLSWTA